MPKFGLQLGLQHHDAVLLLKLQCFLLNLNWTLARVGGQVGWVPSGCFHRWSPLTLNDTCCSKRESQLKTLVERWSSRVQAAKRWTYDTRSPTADLEQVDRITPLRKLTGVVSGMRRSESTEWPHSPLDPLRLSLSLPLTYWTPLPNFRSWEALPGSTSRRKTLMKC